MEQKFNPGLALIGLSETGPSLAPQVFLTAMLNSNKVKELGVPSSLPLGITLELIFVLQSVFLGDKIKEKNQRQSRHYELRQAALARPPKCLHCRLVFSRRLMSY